MRRVGNGWEAGLRQYPDLSLAPGTSRLRHYLSMRDIARQVRASPGQPVVPGMWLVGCS
jgi:hypothetical protein